MLSRLLDDRNGPKPGLKTNPTYGALSMQTPWVAPRCQRKLRYHFDMHRLLKHAIHMISHFSLRIVWVH